MTTMGDDVVLVDAVGGQVARVPRAALVAQGGVTDAIVWRGRVFRPHVDEAWHEAATVVVQTPYACPVCRVERTDYEGEPGRYLPECPSCGTVKPPLPVGLADEQGRWVAVPRDLVAALRSEIRASSGHWAQGFDGLDRSIVKHDRRGPGGTCVSCSLLELMDAYLHPGRDELVVPDGA